MPTSPRDLTDGKCRFLWENPPPCHRTSRADVGIGPYAVGEAIPSILPQLNSSGVPSTPAAAAAPSPSRRGLRLPPAGEGYLRRGRSLTFPWGKVPPQRRKRGRLPCVKGAVSRRLTEGSPCCIGTAPHPSGLRPATLSQERVFSQFVPIRSRDSRRLPSSSTAIRSRTCSTSAFMSLASHSIRVPTMACL